MTSFWKKITGRAALEKKWMSTPRVLPEAFRNLPPGDDKFVVTGEFAHVDSKQKHQYVAAEQQKDGTWRRFRYDVNLETGVNEIYESGVLFKTPMEVVRSLNDWHHQRVNCGKNKNGELIYQMVAGQDATYAAFARRHGIQFDKRGVPYHVKPEHAASRNVFLKGEALSKVFTQQNVDMNALKTWDGLYGVLAKMRPSYDQFTDAADLPSVQCMKVVSELFPFGDDDNFQDVIEKMEGERLTNRAVIKVGFQLYLCGMLAGGAKLYAQARHEGMGNAKSTLSELRDVNTEIESIATQYLCFTSAQVKVIKNLVMVEPPSDVLAPIREYLGGLELHLKAQQQPEEKQDYRDSGKKKKPSGPGPA